MKYTFLHIQPRCVFFQYNLRLFSGVCSCNHVDSVRGDDKKNLRKQPMFNHKSNENVHHTYMQIHTQKHTTRYGVLSLCGPVLGCGVKQEMCEP